MLCRIHSFVTEITPKNINKSVIIATVCKARRSFLTLSCKSKAKDNETFKERSYTSCGNSQTSLFLSAFDKKSWPRLQKYSTTVCSSKNLNSSTLGVNLHMTNVCQTRTFFGNVTIAFNKVDKERVRLAGPDRACAEWVLRNGGTIRWKDSPKPLTNYNFLPSTNFSSYKIEDIDLSTTNVIGLGFEHLHNLKHVKSIKLCGCRTIEDGALSALSYVGGTLTHLHISTCPGITGEGLQELNQLRNLKQVIIYEMDGVKNFDSTISKLKDSMPWCQFVTSNPNAAKED